MLGIKHTNYITENQLIVEYAWLMITNALRGDVALFKIMITTPLYFVSSSSLSFYEVEYLLLVI